VVGMTTDPGPLPDERRPRAQLHVWVDVEVAAWLRQRAHDERRSRGRAVEAILIHEQQREAVERALARS